MQGGFVVPSRLAPHEKCPACNPNHLRLDRVRDIPSSRRSSHFHPRCERLMPLSLNQTYPYCNSMIRFATRGTRIHQPMVNCCVMGRLLTGLFALSLLRVNQRRKATMKRAVRTASLGLTLAALVILQSQLFSHDD